MSAFVDTSFLVALLDEDDARFDEAAHMWRRAGAVHLPVATSNYVVVETCAVLQRRLGLGAVRTLLRETLAPAAVEWVTAEDHERATEALLAADRRRLSLVDCTSFEIMRRLGIAEFLAFDPHFVEQGFAPLTT